MSPSADACSEIGFSALCSQLDALDDGYGIEIPESWCQGRTAYGGVTAGMSLVAVGREFPGLPPLRSMLVNFTGPVSGQTLFVPQILRRGKHVTTVQVTVYREISVVAQVIFSFGDSRASGLLVNGDRQVPNQHPEDCEPFTPPQVADFVPQFFHRFDTRLIGGSRPFSGADQGYMRVVSRHVDPNSRTGIASLVTIADVLPPAALPMASEIAPVSSMSWMFNLLTDQPRTAEGWWCLEARQTAASDGYGSQQMKIWSAEGTLVAEGMQSVALFF